MKIYLSTPVNARSEKDFEARKRGALLRCEALRQRTREAFPGWQAVSPFDVNPIDEPVSEEEALGRCVTALLECDALLLDTGWTKSKGCSLEFRAAQIYGKRVFCLTEGDEKIEEIKWFVKIGADMLMSSNEKTIDTL